MKKVGKFKYFNFLKKANFKLFIFFLIAAFAFLMLTKFAQSFTQELQLQIEVNNLEDEVVIVNDSIVTATITVKAKGFSLLKYLFTTTEKIAIDAKKETSKKGNRLFYDLRNNRYKLKKSIGNSIDIINVNPDTVYFDFDLLAKKKVPVNIVRDINFIDGYNIAGRLKTSKDSVTIIASKIAIDSITELNTLPINLNNVSTDIYEIIGFQKPISNLKIVPNEILVSGSVKRFTEGKFSIPIKLINLDSKKTVNFFPKQAELIFYSDIDSYKNIKPSDFLVVADFSKINFENENSVNLKVSSYPEAVKSVRLIQNRIEYILSDQ